MLPRLSLAPARPVTGRPGEQSWQDGVSALTRLFGAGAPPQLLRPRENTEVAEEKVDLHDSRVTQRGEKKNAQIRAKEC